jgi:hypothetical protein
MASVHYLQPRRESRSTRPWEAPPYREIEMKIGEGLRKRYAAPQELPHRLLALVMQIKGQDDDD